MQCSIASLIGMVEERLERFRLHDFSILQGVDDGVGGVQIPCLTGNLQNGLAAWCQHVRLGPNLQQVCNNLCQACVGRVLQGTVPIVVLHITHRDLLRLFGFVLQHIQKLQRRRCARRVPCSEVQRQVLFSVWLLHQLQKVKWLPPGHWLLVSTVVQARAPQVGLALPQAFIAHAWLVVDLTLVSHELLNNFGHGCEGGDVDCVHSRVVCLGGVSPISQQHRQHLGGSKS
mmetsp:Transcript_56723/g.101144  ORF Transcript_56723/g.101144 Transcript_56723/m.101144 type:complete len:230 (+) Transcript_56723:2129-2818(+)